MGFNIDFEKITLNVLEQLLLESSLVPSRMILKEHSDNHFEILRKQNIRNVNELLHKLKNKKEIIELANQTGISSEYLTILAREIKSYKRKPIKIAEFPGLKSNTAQSLGKVGIVNSLHLFDEALTSESRDELASLSGIDKQELLMATKLVDLSRIRWVNRTFAFVLYESGYDTAEKVATADPEELYEKVKKVNDERKFFPAHIGLTDMKRCVESAQLVGLDIEY